MLKLVAPHAGENHNLLHVGLVHDADHIRRGHLIADAGRVIGVIVNVNDIELCALRKMFGHMQHGLGVKILEQHGLSLIGVRR